MNEKPSLWLVLANRSPSDHWPAASGSRSLDLAVLLIVSIPYAFGKAWSFFKRRQSQSDRPVVAIGSGSVAGVGGSVKVDKNGLTVTPQIEKAADKKIGLHAHLGVGVGIKLNLSQASRAYDRSVRQVSALLNWVSDQAHGFNLPGFPRSPNAGPAAN